MKVRMTITDLTRMGGARVCVAGVTDEGQCIRPEFADGPILENWLFDNDQVIIRPFARVILKLIKPIPQPPHSEDWIVDENYKQHLGDFDLEERNKFLRNILDPNVSSIFGADIQTDIGYYICEDEGNRSLGTIQVAEIVNFSHVPRDGKWDYRLSFIDRSGENFRLKITDLAFRNYIDYLRIQRETPFYDIGHQITETLQQSLVFLRIGLARPTWDEHPHCCFLQINGVYTFPDYLGGRCFADFRR